MVKNRDNFPASVIEVLKKRAAYICSNPNCKKMTIAPSSSDNNKVIYIGRAAHISAASQNGPRYEPNISGEERSSINNAIFLCSNCADMIDDNGGIDFQASTIKKWKAEHEKWVWENLNKNIINNSGQTIIHNNIISYNQSGGITAHTVNVWIEQRTLTPDLIKELQTLITNDDIVSVWSVNGNLESINFGNEIFEWLKNNNYKTMYPHIIEVTSYPSQIGQSIHRSDSNNPKHVEIRIGING